MFVVALLYQLEQPHLRSGLIALARTVALVVCTYIHAILDKTPGKEVKRYQVWRSWWPRCQSPTHYPTFGQVVIEKRFHSQVKVGWFPISAGRVNG
jgi:hypothetical protein